MALNLPGAEGSYFVQIWIEKQEGFKTEPLLGLEHRTGGHRGHKS